MTTIQFAPAPQRDTRRVLASLDALTVLQRQVFVLHGAAGLSIPETARQLGLKWDQVSGIYAAACQRLTNATATAPEVFRGSPENPPSTANNPPDLQSCAPAQNSGGCPPWCSGCKPEADGARFHLSHGKATDFHEGEQPEVCLSRLDDDGEPGTVMVELFLGLKANASLTAEQALALAGLLREYALTAIGGAQ